jgi:hypothetical protein
MESVPSGRCCIDERVAFADSGLGLIRWSVIILTRKLPWLMDHSGPVVEWNTR